LPIKFQSGHLKGDKLRNTIYGYLGIYSLFIYIASINYGVLFKIHREDLDSILFIITIFGSLKIWIMMAPHHAERLEQSFKEDLICLREKALFDL